MASTAASTAAATASAAILFTFVIVVMVTVYSLGLKFSHKEKFHRLIRISGHSGVHINTGLIKSRCRSVSARESAMALKD